MPRTLAPAPTRKQALSAQLLALAPGHTYYYRACQTELEHGAATGRTYCYRVTATNADGTTPGQPESFTTPGETLTKVGQAVPGLAGELYAVAKLAKKLVKCRKEKGQGKRSRCEAAAHRRYGGAKKTKSRGKRKE